jgi:hypothetical protein
VLDADAEALISGYEILYVAAIKIGDCGDPLIEDRPVAKLQSRIGEFCFEELGLHVSGLTLISE